MDGRLAISSLHLPSSKKLVGFRIFLQSHRDHAWQQLPFPPDTEFGELQYLLAKLSTSYLPVAGLSTRYQYSHESKRR